jgi:hypothetical protein
MIVALVLGTLLALATSAFVLAPLVIGVRRPSVTRSVRNSPSPSDLSIAALREIEFDRATGKLSDADYGVLRERYASEAIAAMRSAAKGELPAADDPVEAAVRAFRSIHATCPDCGLRPEADAIYCSNCGRFLPGTCDGCGKAITASGIRYCIDCGRRLAA